MSAIKQKGPQSGTKGIGTRGGIKPTSQPARMVAAIQSAGERGITTGELQALLQTDLRTMIQVRRRAREAGFKIHTLNRGAGYDAIFFALAIWCDAAAKAWKAGAPARKAAYEAKPHRREAQRRNAARAAQRRNAARAAQREKAAREAKKAVQPPKPKPAKTPKLHNVGAVVPGVRNRDGTLSTAYQQSAARFRSPQAVVSTARVVDYSKAVHIVAKTQPGRYEVTGPVYRAIDSSECRPWAKAAAGAMGS